ncbi:chemotaxis protein CheW [Alteromonas confluentis]|uniref:Chemotaxis protein CheW n=1 Tax=Alteromonas confluentis TaxID=1656094 RepID=A0A1E7Z8J7_9ALTE|nr:chemotaxis protein CheW [Alteromonas confluentis]OFC69873.1 chemotaxis protein CheW [Alteromonas confluentis]
MSNGRDHMQAKDVQEYLSFILSDEHYALDITSVKEIRGYEKVTPIANAPAFIKGVLNLRGDIVPIIDLRIKFNIPNPTYNEFTIVIMLHVHNRVIGIVVDGVSDVVRLTEDEVRPPPDFGVIFDSRFLKGLATVDDRMIILVNIEQLISSGELGLVDKTLAKEEV